jgi:hypothetical protein
MSGVTAKNVPDVVVNKTRSGIVDFFCQVANLKRKITTLKFLNFA